MLNRISDTFNVWYVPLTFQWWNILPNNTGTFRIYCTFNPFMSCYVRVVEFVYFKIKRAFCVMISAFKALHTCVNPCKSSFPSIKIKVTYLHLYFSNATGSGNNATLVRKSFSVLSQFLFCFTNIIRFWLFTCLPLTATPRTAFFKPLRLFTCLHFTLRYISSWVSVA